MTAPSIPKPDPKTFYVCVENHTGDRGTFTRDQVPAPRLQLDDAPEDHDPAQPGQDRHGAGSEAERQVTRWR
jgi:hypothetical protein